MKTLIRISAFCLAIALFNSNDMYAQIGGNTYAAGDQNLGDLDQLDQTISMAVRLETILQLNAPDDSNVSFSFDEMEEFKKGINGNNPTNGGQFVSDGVHNGVNLFSVDATVNWKLDWRADAQEAYILGNNNGNNREQRFLLNNVGAIVGTGVSNNNLEPMDDGAIALTNFDVTILKRADGSSNIGQGSDNKFRIKWRVGTKEQPNKNNTPAMNPLSILEQQIGSEAYEFDVIFTLSQDDPWIQ